MKICIPGGTGFLGQALKNYWESRGHQVSILTRNPKQKGEVKWDGKTLGSWKEEIEKADVLINLTGKSVDCRYNEMNKKAILSSRVDSTRVLHQALAAVKAPPKVWINASSATIYKHSEERMNTEANGIIGDNFSENVCKEWEKHFFSTTHTGTRQVSARTSIVLGAGGGALPKIKQIARLGLGGKQGLGSQKMSWISIEDFCAAMDFIIANEELEGPINVTAPNPTDNQTFMKTVRGSLKLPFGIPQPAWLLEFGAILIRTETELLLKSRYVYPEILLDAGFEFKHPTVHSALEAV